MNKAQQAYKMAQAVAPELERIRLDSIEKEYKRIIDSIGYASGGGYMNRRFHFENPEAITIRLQQDGFLITKEGDDFLVSWDVSGE